MRHCRPPGEQPAERPIALISYVNVIEIVTSVFQARDGRAGSSGLTLAAALRCAA